VTKDFKYTLLWTKGSLKSLAQVGCAQVEDYVGSPQVSNNQSMARMKSYKLKRMI